jgi:hypothetical protein
MSNGKNVWETLYKQETMIRKMLLDKVRDPDKYSEYLQAFINPARNDAKSPVTNELVHVDRSVRPVYPTWATVVMHPELEALGPTEFDPSKLELWLHPRQVQWWTPAQVIYDFLKENNMLAECLGLSDLMAIKSRGLDFYRRFFGSMTLIGWKSVVGYYRNSVVAPALIEDSGEVDLYWHLVKHNLGSGDPAPRFAK